MKKLAILIVSILFLSGHNLSAQMHKTQKKQQPDMMQEGMMQSGMQGMMCPMCGGMTDQHMPMKKYVMMVNMLPGMQEKLSLSDEQVVQLIDLQTAFKKQQVDYKADLTKKQMKMKTLLNDAATANMIKQQMQACADVKIDMKIAAYETAGKMKAILTNEQKEKMKNMMASTGGVTQNKMKKN
jgi:hypothetical protein